MARVAVNKNQVARNGGWTPPPPGVFKVNVDGRHQRMGETLVLGLLLETLMGLLQQLATNISKVIFQ